jgi:molecular chaperone DnaK (HSP70)
MKDVDRKKREMIDLKNEADTCIHTTEKSLSEHKENIKTEVADEIQ